MVNGSNGPEQSRGRKPPVLASVLSALLSGMAAGVANSAFFKAAGHLSDDNIKNIVAGLAALATLLTTTTVGGGAGRKRQASRVSRGRIERLNLTLSAASQNSEKSYGKAQHGQHWNGLQHRHYSQNPWLRVGCFEKC